MSTERRLLLWLAIATAFGVIVYVLRQPLVPFIAGLAVGYLFDPLADRLEAARVPRGIAAALIVVGFLLVFVGVLVVLIPLLSAQITEFIGRLPAYADMAEAWIAPQVADLKARLGHEQAERLDTFLRSYAGSLTTWAGKLVSNVLSGGAAVLNVLGLLVITPVVAFYLLRDWDRLVARVDDLLPERGGDQIRRIARDIDHRLSGFIRGQVIVCLILGAWYATGLLLIGLDFGLLLGLGAGLISVIPYVGNLVGLGASLAVAFAQFDGWLNPILVAAVFGSGQIIEGYFVQPKIIGDRVGLHPVWLMFAVIAGSALLGITGALLAVLVAAIAGVLVRYAVEKYRQSPLYRETRASAPAGPAGAGADATGVALPAAPAGNPSAAPDDDRDRTRGDSP
jgi:predicted PurR-regulated permease PerM